MRRALLVLLLLAAAPLSARELYWDSIEVTARLDAGGTLHVRERQQFVFTGDWNGGERSFRVEEGQELAVVAMRRIDPASGAVELRDGDLSAVDDYRLAGDVLRWRSRLPSDPPFEQTHLTYEIEYELHHILVGLAAGSGGERRYLLNNDFSFADRLGAINHFRLKLELDPVWHSSQPIPSEFTAEGLQPGNSFIVRRELTYSGAGAPATAFTAPWSLVRYTVLLLLIAGLPAIFVQFWRGENARGRFLRENPAIDESWLEEHIFSHPPGVIGYIHDGKSGPSQVAATLARMQQEGTITSSVERRALRAPLLRMTLREGEFDLNAQEMQLVNLFFLKGSHETDTDTIRKHYRKRGFDPAQSIEPGLLRGARAYPGWSQDKPRPLDRGESGTLVVAFLLLVTGAFFGFSSLWLMLYMGVLGGIACAIGRTVARRSANQVRRLPLRWLGASVPTLLVAWLLGSVARRELSHVKEYPLLVAAAFVLVVYWFVLRAARTEQTPEKILVRARIAAARRWFANELRRPIPNLRDAWTPYLLALGLGRHAERWFSRFAGQASVAAGSGLSSATTSSHSSASWGSSASASATGSGWTGGGGSFGGAGATASWAAAASSLGSGSSAPSSSGGGSSGGGGGGSSGGSSSSGGGGGGGW